MISIIYWSFTQNTFAIAKTLHESLENSKLIAVNKATEKDVYSAVAIAFGSPAMGIEAIEQREMEPFIKSVSKYLKGKKVLLFGSYDWGDGEWIRNWEKQMKGYEASLIIPSLIINSYPTEKEFELIRERAKELL